MGKKNNVKSLGGKITDDRDITSTGSPFFFYSYGAAFFLLLFCPAWIFFLSSRTTSVFFFIRIHNLYVGPPHHQINNFVHFFFSFYSKINNRRVNKIVQLRKSSNYIEQFKNWNLKRPTGKGSDWKKKIQISSRNPICFYLVKKKNGFKYIKSTETEKKTSENLLIFSLLRL